MNLEHLLTAIPMPKPSDLWAFWLLAGLWMGMLSTAWVVYRWLRRDDESTRGL